MRENILQHPASSIQHPAFTVACWGLRTGVLLLGMLYFVTAIGKGTQVFRTAVVIDSVLPVNSFVSQAMVYVLVVVELGLAGMLTSGYQLRLANLVSFGLGVLFLIWHLLVWLQPGTIDCGCGAPLMVKELIGDLSSGLLLASVVVAVSGISVVVDLKKKNRSPSS